MAQRENIYEACFQQIQTTSPSLIQIPLFSRRFKHWDKVDLRFFPACYMQQYEETGDQENNMGLTRWKSTVNVWFYFNAINPNNFPDETYNNLIDALEVAFKPSPVTGRLTLGGLVTHCWLDGKIYYSDGALDHKAVILAQIHLLWNGF